MPFRQRRMWYTSFNLFQEGFGSNLVSNRFLRRMLSLYVSAKCQKGLLSHRHGAGQHFENKSNFAKLAAHETDFEITAE